MSAKIVETEEKCLRGKTAKAEERARVAKIGKAEEKAAKLRSTSRSTYDRQLQGSLSSSMHHPASSALIEI